MFHKAGKGWICKKLHNFKQFESTGTVRIGNCMSRTLNIDRFSEISVQYSLGESNKSSKTQFIRKEKPKDELDN